MSADLPSPAAARWPWRGAAIAAVLTLLCGCSGLIQYLPPSMWTFAATIALLPAGILLWGAPLPERRRSPVFKAAGVILVLDLGFAALGVVGHRDEQRCLGAFEADRAGLQALTEAVRAARARGIEPYECEECLGLARSRLGARRLTGSGDPDGFALYCIFAGDALSPLVLGYQYSPHAAPKPGRRPVRPLGEGWYRLE